MLVSARSLAVGLVAGSVLLGGLLFAQDEAIVTGTVVGEEPSDAIVVEPSAEALKAFERTVPQSVDDLQAIQDHVATLTEKVMPCVVGVRIGNAQGSGVIVSKDGYVLTAAHVSGRPDRNATFILPDGRRLQGKTLGRNTAIDAGLMKITTEGEWPFVEMADIDTVDAGDWTVAMGHPGGYRDGRTPVVRLGRIVSKRNNVLQTDNALVGGDSGGPLFDASGRVIGIHSRIGPSINWNFHVPISYYTDDWEDLALSKEWGRGSPASPTVLGVNGEDHPEGGALVTGVPETWPAASAGVKVDDVITKVDDQEIKTFDDLSGYVSEQSPGDMVTLTIRRGGRTITVDVKLGDRRR